MSDRTKTILISSTLGAGLVVFVIVIFFIFKAYRSRCFTKHVKSWEILNYEYDKLNASVSNSNISKYGSQINVNIND
jgi:hypothetical protein